VHGYSNFPYVALFILYYGLYFRLSRKGEGEEGRWRGEGKPSSAVPTTDDVEEGDGVGDDDAGDGDEARDDDGDARDRAGAGAAPSWHTALPGSGGDVRVQAAVR